MGGGSFCKLLKLEKRVALTHRLINTEDFKTLVHFFEQNNKHEITRQFTAFPLTSDTAYKIACTDHMDRYYFACWHEHTIALLMLRGWDQGFEIPSFGILVDHHYRGFGLGRQITEFGISEARNLGCQSIRLSVYASNVHAVRLYLFLGFQEIIRESCICAGERDEKIIMLKNLR